MSQTDSFIDEVSEEVRRDRLFALFRKYGWIPVLLIVALVGGAGWNEWRITQDRAEAQAFGDAVLSARAANDPASRVAALDAIQAEGPRRAILGLLKAAEAEAAGDAATALAELEALAADATLPVGYRDLAGLKRVLIAGDTMPADARKAVLDDLSQAGRPYRALALEQLAMLAVAAGDTESALTQLRAVLQEPDVTSGLRQRVTQMIVALGGTVQAS